MTKAHTGSESVDGVSRLLEYVAPKITTFYVGPLCGLHEFDSASGVGHLHVIRTGRVEASQPECPTINVTKPTLLFYPSPTNHRLVVDDRYPADVLCASIQYSSGFENPLTRSLPTLLAVPFDSVPRLEGTLINIFEEGFETNPGRQVMLDRLCDVLIIQVIRFALMQGHVHYGMLNGLTHSKLSGLLGMMQIEPAGRWTLKRMAETCHLSRSAFTKEFQRVMGTTPAAFNKQLRLAHAQRLLKKGQSVALAAEKSGFSSQPAFSRAFTRMVGISPSDWLKLWVTGN